MNVASHQLNKKTYVFSRIQRENATKAKTEDNCKTGAVPAVSTDVEQGTISHTLTEIESEKSAKINEDYVEDLSLDVRF